MQAFAEWLRDTPMSLNIQTTEWMLPIIQSIHILAIGVIFASVLVVALRVFGVVARNQSMGATAARFVPWVWGSLLVLLATGVLMIVAEPVRELMSPAFWTKMALIVVGGVITLLFQGHVKRQASGEGAAGEPTAVRIAAAGTIVVWCAIIFLGRWIAYAPTWAVY